MGLVAEVATAQTDGVDAGVGDGVASYLDVGGESLLTCEPPLYHHVCTDVAELVDEGAPADGRHSCR